MKTCPECGLTDKSVYYRSVASTLPGVGAKAGFPPKTVCLSCFKKYVAEARVVCQRKAQERRAAEEEIQREYRRSLSGLCFGCRFYRGSDRAGVCRRRAPSAWDEGGDGCGEPVALWPLVNADDWCGEWQVTP